jgi:TRAP-type C4-dicarboxylate transport system permease small subunit
MMITGTAVTLLIMAGALMRYIFKIDFYGSEEIILMIGFWLFFVGSISAARSKSHLNANMVSVFTRNERAVNIAALVKDILSLVICCLAIKWCYDYWSWTFALNPRTSVHKLPYYIQQFPMCVSFQMWGLYLIRDCCNSVLAVRSSFRKKNESLWEGKEHDGTDCAYNPYGGNDDRHPHPAVLFDFPAYVCVNGGYNP